MDQDKDPGSNHRGRLNQQDPAHHAGPARDLHLAAKRASGQVARGFLQGRVGQRASVQDGLPHLMALQRRKAVPLDKPPVHWISRRAKPIDRGRGRFQVAAELPCSRGQANGEGHDYGPRPHHGTVVPQARADAQSRPGPDHPAVRRGLLVEIRVRIGFLRQDGYLSEPAAR